MSSLYKIHNYIIRSHCCIIMYCYCIMMCCNALQGIVNLAEDPLPEVAKMAASVITDLKNKVQCILYSRAINDT